MPISVLIITLNEEVHLDKCLDSVSWCDDILVLDSFSTDGTVAIAHAAGARVLQRSFDTFAGQRNYGMKHGELRHDWVLHLDADEVVPPEMRDEILEVTRSTRLSAFRLSMKLIFHDRWLKRASMFPAYQVRLGRRDRLRFKMAGHGQREDLPKEEIGTLKSSLLHFSFIKGWADWFEKHNRYSTAEASESVKLQVSERTWGIRDLFSRERSIRWRALKDLSAKVPCRPVVRFIYMYFIRKGFLDGIAGLQYCLLLVVYEFMIVLKVQEISRRDRMAVAQDMEILEEASEAAVASNGDVEPSRAIGHPAHT